MKTSLYVPFVLALGVGRALAQTPEPSKTAGQSKALAPWQLEWAYLSKYRDADAKLGPPRKSEKRVIFLGDSITEGWGEIEPNFFVANKYINRGISGQTTSQMLVRFRQDVIDLDPAVVVILGGTNDIAENGGITTLEAIEQNLESMAELARLHSIRVVLASVLPTLDYPWRLGLEPAGKIQALNRWIQEYCSRNQLVYLDYYSAVAGADRAMKDGLSKDGVHPTGAGYSIMEPLVQDAVARSIVP